MTREEREDAIDIIQSILDKYEEDECLVTEITIGDEDIKAFKMAIKALEQEPRWIPVSERLPEEDGQYLITIKYKHVDDSYEDVYAEHGEWSSGRWDMFCFGHCGEVEDIIAWMPLPPSYQGE